ncbi:hypothetical protein [Rubritalea profundi]|uniref:Uncharacterized protein n=1 Tax=Rubritalea profundi TaxID=1658618 RepID=A0A2S7TZB5_9BACT|nr:hypothetical protein [Rubritalea profundi]PQJ27670.1 hypothetical protein BSZ32_03590 [Rubritalea profundi]
MSEIPSVKYTVILLAVLFVPFIMKEELREPYPALILPSGASTAKVKGGEVSSTKYLGYGITQDGVREEIDLVELIRPAPSHYLKYIFKNDFGLRSGRIEAAKGRKKWKYTARASTPENVEDCKRWVSQKIGSQYVALEVIEKKGAGPAVRWSDLF